MFGLPWMEKASLHDNVDLHKAWVNLFVSMTIDPKSDLHATYVNILGELTPLDCRVLEHVVTNGLAQDAEGHLMPIPQSEDSILEALVLARGNVDTTAVLVSIESLVRQCCLTKVPPAPLTHPSQLMHYRNINLLIIFNSTLIGRHYNDLFQAEMVGRQT